MLSEKHKPLYELYSQIKQPEKDDFNLSRYLFKKISFKKFTFASSSSSIIAIRNFEFLKVSSWVKIVWKTITFLCICDCLSSKTYLKWRCKVSLTFWRRLQGKFNRVWKTTHQRKDSQFHKAGELSCSRKQPISQTHDQDQNFVYDFDANLSATYSFLSYCISYTYCW